MAKLEHLKKEKNIANVFARTYSIYNNVLFLHKIGLIVSVL